MKLSWSRAWQSAALVVAAFASLVSVHARAATPAEIRVDYAYYSPESLVIRHFGWLEDEFKADRTSIRWVLSLGSNRALEYLNSGAVDFGSAAGLASVLARANGNPIHTVYVFSRPEWTALVVLQGFADPLARRPEGQENRRDARHRSVPVHATRAAHGRPDPRRRRNRQPAASGRAHRACERPVDAWAGLDPHMAAAQLDDGARLLYRNVTFNTYGFLNVRDAFASQYPQAVTRVLKVYDRARQWIVAHPADTAQIVADESKVSLPVAKLQLQRNDFSDPVPGDTQRARAEGGRPRIDGRTADQARRRSREDRRYADRSVVRAPARRRIALSCRP